MFHRERVEVEYRSLQEELDYGATVFSPLACGVLTGKYNDGIPSGSRLALNPEQLKEEIEHLQSPNGQSQIAKIKSLAQVAERLGVKIAILALAWCIKNESVSSVITAASRGRLLNPHCGVNG